MKSISVLVSDNLRFTIQKIDGGFKVCVSDGGFDVIFNISNDNISSIITWMHSPDETLCLMLDNKYQIMLYSSPSGSNVSIVIRHEFSNSSTIDFTFNITSAWVLPWLKLLDAW